MVIHGQMFTEVDSEVSHSLGVVDGACSIVNLINKLFGISLTEHNQLSSHRSTSVYPLLEAFDTIFDRSFQYHQMILCDTYIQLCVI